MKDIAAAFASLDQAAISAIQAAGDYTLSLPGGDVVLEKADYEISSEDMPGWLVATEGTLTLALDVEVTEELRREGTARELVNRIQNIRKDSGFDVTDRVEVRIYADGEDAARIEAALQDYRDYLCAQTLALSLALLPQAQAGADAAEVEWEEKTIRISVTRK
jgi:isoleucyl-tRNA synthetase